MDPFQVALLDLTLLLLTYTRDKAAIMMLQAATTTSERMLIQET